MVAANKLKVTVINGRGLVCKESKKEVSPFCVLQVGKQSQQTSFIRNNSNPQWNEDFVFIVNPDCEVLSFSIWHKNSTKTDVVIGYAFVDFGSCKSDEKTTISIQLKGIYSGEIKLSLYPLYETTASKLERLERDVSLLRFESTSFSNRNELLTKQVRELTLANEELTKKYALLERERNTLLEYDILECSNLRSFRSCTCLARETPRLRRRVLDEAEKKVNGVGHSRLSLFDDEFDIISDSEEKNIDIDIAQLKNKGEIKVDHMTSDEFIDDDAKNDEVNESSFALTSGIESDQSSDGILEDEADRSHRKHKQCTYGEVVNNDNTNTDTINEDCEIDALISKVMSLEEENSELKLLVQQMEYETRDELNQLIEELDSKEECEYCDAIIISNIAKIRHNNTHPTDLILENSIDKIEINEFEENELNYRREGELDPNRHRETQSAELSLKLPDEPDVIKEYFWDEYLPISTLSSNNDVESTEKIFEEVSSNIVEGITEDIDDFIKNNYLFHNGSTLILRSDPELYTRSEMEEENEHFKEMNIKLIKENEELDACRQLLQVQMKNFKKIQAVLFDQLIERAPSCMRKLIEKFDDSPPALNEDQVTLYKSHLRSILNEIPVVDDEETEFKDRSPRDQIARSLMYHQLSAT